MTPLVTSDAPLGLLERRRRLVQELTGRGLVRLASRGVLDLGVSDLELQPVLQWAGVRWVYALTVPRSTASAYGADPSERDMAELWTDPWVVALLHGISAEFSVLRVAAEPVRPKVHAAHLRHGAERLSDEDRAALVVVYDLTPDDPEAAQQFLRARAAFTSTPTWPTKDQWQKAIREVRGLEPPPLYSDEHPEGGRRVW